MAKFDADDLTRTSEIALPIEPTAQGIEISPDTTFLSFCDFPSNDDSPDNALYTGYIYDLSDGKLSTLGPQCLYTKPVWSPTGRRLAYCSLGDGGQKSIRIAAITNSSIRESDDIASINSDDLSGDITGPDPVWSPDGGQLAFVSYEGGGSAIYLSNGSFESCAKILQTRGLIQSLGLVKTS